MSSDRVLRWLHISDLHCPREKDVAWEAAVRESLRGLARLHDAPRPIDAVLISGDMTRTGHVEEFDRAARLVDEIREWMTNGAGTPFVLAVPGNHDEQRAEASGFGVADVDTERRFANWRSWWSALVEKLPREVTVREGLEPGDFSATFESAKRDLRFGVVGINTAAIGLDPKVHAPVRLNERLRALCGHALADWTRYHDASALLAHHAPVGDGLPGSWGAIAEAGFSTAHFGHLHTVGDRGGLTKTARMIVSQSLSFAGYDAQGVGGYHQIRSAGATVFELDRTFSDETIVCASRHSLRASDRIEEAPDRVVRLLSVPRSERLPSGLPEAITAARAEDERDDDLSREELTELIREVIPEEGDFRAFTLTQFRELHRRFSYGMDRKARLQVLLREVSSRAIIDALRRYLPDTTEARLAVLRARSAPRNSYQVSRLR